MVNITINKMWKKMILDEKKAETTYNSSIIG